MIEKHKIHSVQPAYSTYSMSGSPDDVFLNPTQTKQRDEAVAAMKNAEREEYMKTRKWREASSAMGGGAGPESMTSDDYATVHDVRRQIWTSGFRGFLAGGVIGAVGSTLYPMLQQKGLIRLAFKMEPKHRTGAILTLSALGMLLGASTTGQRNSWRMTNIYTRGAKPSLSRYQKIMAGQDLTEEESGRKYEVDDNWGYKPAQASEVQVDNEGREKERSSGGLNLSQRSM